MSYALKSSSAIALALFVSACGGGGSEFSSTVPPSAPVSLPAQIPTPVTTPVQTDFNTAEYQRSKAMGAVNVLPAWEAGATGRGITIGFVDTGLTTSAEFAGRIHEASRSFVGGSSINDVYGHGTALAGIAAGARNDSGISGIAYEATIYVAKADENCPNNCSFDRKALADGIDGARLAGAKVINLSIGGTGDDAIFAAVERAIKAGIIIVVSAGNDVPNPTIFARKIAAIDPNMVMIVGSTGVKQADGSIDYTQVAEFTPKAGENKNVFVVAPGWLVAGVTANGGVGHFTGTSFSSPIVSGAVALLAQAYPMLTPQQIVKLIQVTATDLGLAGIDDTYGHGQLNIGRAFQPVGTMRLAGEATPLPAILGNLPAAAGDAASDSGLAATALDQFDRPFEVDLGARFAQVPPTALLHQTISDPQTSANFDIGSSTFSIATTRPGLTSNDPIKASRLLAANIISRINRKTVLALGLKTSAEALRASGSRALADNFMLTSDNAVPFEGEAKASALLSRQVGAWSLSLSADMGDLNSRSFSEPSRFYSQSFGIGRSILGGDAELTLTRFKENASVLGGSFLSIFEKGGSLTNLADARYALRLSPIWSVGVNYRRGWTVTGTDLLKSSAMSVDVGRHDIFGNDRLALRLSQPLRIDRGGLSSRLPVDWDYLAGQASYGTRRFSLTPSGREVALELGYRRLVQSGSFSLHAYGRKDPGHRADSPTDFGAAVRANLKI